MSITGLIIHTAPKNAASVQQAVEALEGTEVHKVTHDGRMIVTVDNEDDGKATQTFDAFRSIAGVLSTSLVYTHFEDDYGVGEHQS
ncbi:chaperone NapD [Magnetovibrio blakemorei]|uniref:chaperone NapD n=1 Tax=Magnetovibrio blakemorei TaxID=28181 RepID=UPI00147BA8AF|nr:chaperone NapD [Magnetovibrio blakemorei]